MDWSKDYRESWQKLGFYYEYKNEDKTWKIHGSIKGLQKFSRIFIDYASNQTHAGISEHEHYGPYEYLKIITWELPKIDEQGVWGTLEDIRKLGGLIEEKLSQKTLLFTIDKEYSNFNEAVISVKIESDNFDPASLDSDL